VPRRQVVTASIASLLWVALVGLFWMAVTPPRRMPCFGPGEEDRVRVACPEAYPFAALLEGALPWIVVLAIGLGIVWTVSSRPGRPRRVTPPEVIRDTVPKRRH
jgi:hypothetical protein